MEKNKEQFEVRQYFDTYLEKEWVFNTKEEAQKVIDSKEWKDFWEKVRAGEIGG